jgi:hypothetical protein
MEQQLELTQPQAINVLIQAARIGQSKGAFTLEDAELIVKAIKLFTPEKPAETVPDQLGDDQPSHDPAINQ